jgi:hypothetical protein
LAFIDGYAFHSFANIFFRIGDGLKNFPWIVGFEFQGIHLAMPQRIPALNNSRAAFGVVVGLEDQDKLARVLTTHLRAPQQFRGFVASHRSKQQFQLALHNIAPENNLSYPGFHST